MEIIVRGRHMTVPPRFRQHAAAKLAKLEKLDQKVVRIDVEVSEERNPRQSDRRERVELTIRSRGPAIRAEAAADDRYAALDLAVAKLESRLRRACDRRKIKHTDNVTLRSPDLVATDALPAAALNGNGAARPRTGEMDDRGDEPGFGAADSYGADSYGADSYGADSYGADSYGTGPARAEPDSRLVPIQMEGDGPLVLREKVHPARPMTIDQALFEMELVGHDFYLFHDSECDRFSVVYRRRGYDYGVIRLVEE
jgi:ribosomal subunit interface protein